MSLLTIYYYKNLYTYRCREEKDSSNGELSQAYKKYEIVPKKIKINSNASLSSGFQAFPRQFNIMILTRKPSVASKILLPINLPLHFTTHDSFLIKVKQKTTAIIRIPLKTRNELCHMSSEIVSEPLF